LNFEQPELPLGPIDPLRAALPSRQGLPTVEATPVSAKGQAVPSKAEIRVPTKESLPVITADDCRTPGSLKLATYFADLTKTEQDAKENRL